MKILHTIIERKSNQMILPNTKLIFLGFGKDSNGNNIVKLKNQYDGKGFSIKTEKDCKAIDNMINNGITKSELKFKDLENISKGVARYIKKYGTEAQKNSLKIEK